MISAASPIQATPSAPVITSFNASKGANDVWTFYGQVSDANLNGITVALGGIQQLNGVTVQTDANGCFTYSVSVPPTVSGLASAQATDSAGLQSNIATVWVGQTKINPS